MDLPHYHHLLQKRKDTALARLQEDLDRAVREKEEDGCTEESRVNALTSLDHRRQTHRQGLVSESLRSVQALKVKHAQEVAALEERHRIAAVALKENIERQERELEEHFNKQSEALNDALTQAYSQRMEARKTAKTKLDGKRYLEDNTLRNEVFQAFEEEVLAEPERLLASTPPFSQPEPASEATEESKVVVYNKKEDQQEDVHMLWNNAESEVFEPTLQLSKRQKIEARPLHKLPAKPESAPRAKTSFKLKSFSCGNATWHHSPNLFVKVNPHNKIFEIHHGKNSLSAMHPDWVLDGKQGQNSVYNTDANTFGLTREGRIAIWLEFKFAAELTAFLAHYEAYFEEIVPMLGS